MARTPGSGWGAGNPTFQRCPACGRKTFYFYGRVRALGTGYQCTFSRRGCTWDGSLTVTQNNNLVPRRNFDESKTEELLFEIHGTKPAL